MARWLTRVFRGRRVSARSAAGPSPAALAGPLAGTSPSVRIIASGMHATPSPACPQAGGVSFPASATPDSYFSANRFYECSCHDLAPPPLDGLDDGTMLAVASVPGKVPEEWREARPLWMAWPHAAGAIYAVEMTAAQLRARLAAMDKG